MTDALRRVILLFIISILIGNLVFCLKDHDKIEVNSDYSRRLWSLFSNKKNSDKANTKAEKSASLPPPKAVATTKSNHSVSNAPKLTKKAPPAKKDVELREGVKLTGGTYATVIPRTANKVN